MQRKKKAGRGKGCDIGFIDEAKFFKIETIRTGPLAMLLQKAVLIFASTPEIYENPCEGIINGEYNGEKICEYINFELTCPECRIICEKNQFHVCDHRSGWGSAMRDQEITAISQVAYGNNDSFQREIMGTQMTSSCRYIPKEYIENLEAPVWYTFKKPPDYLFFSCDPNGSSIYWEDAQRSFYAMVVIAMVDGQAIVKYIYIYQYYFFICILFLPQQKNKIILIIQIVDYGVENDILSNVWPLTHCQACYAWH